MADDVIPSPWPTLSRLAQMTERERRLLLRLHTERGFEADDPLIPLRNAVDAELAEVSRLELQAEIAPWRFEGNSAFTGITGFAPLIRDSPAFAQYVNGYLFFGVRFAAERIGAGAPSPDAFEWNERRLALPYPPPCEGVDCRNYEPVVDSFLARVGQEQSDVALSFLDDYVLYPDEAWDFELWLRGLLPEPRDPNRFVHIARGLYDWARWRFDFYLSLDRGRERAPAVNALLERTGGMGPATPGSWLASNPLAARYGTYDLYYLSKLLRADVSERGIVRYKHRSWLDYLADRPFEPERAAEWKHELLWIEEVLRAVFDFACDLVQNAVDIAEREARRHDPEQKGSVDPDHPNCRNEFRAVYDDEMAEISRQRYLRGYQEEPVDKDETPADCTKPRYWSRRVRTGKHLENLFGLALSGGGIRSATFSLGILQGLKEMDLLRQVDYLSTVSGGGYIGAWLMGNVRRAHYWLSRLTSWDESITHLRKYSRYLAPRTGVLSADTWVIWGTWIRNASLIQLTTIAWLAFILLSLVGGKGVFDALATPRYSSAGHATLVIICAILGPILSYNLARARTARPSEHRVAVLLAWAGSGISAALLWGIATGREDFSVLLATTFYKWSLLLVWSIVLAFSGIALCSLWPKGGGIPRIVVRILAAPAISALTFGVMYLGLCGVRYIYGVWADTGKDEYAWFAYVFGPPLVLLSLTIAVVVFIGLMGWAAPDWKREWWTRYGSWLAMYGAVAVAFTVAAVFGPHWIGMLFALKWQSIKWGAVLSWLGTVTAGLVAGNSARTRGNTGGGSAKALELVALAGGLLFAIGFVLAISTVLRIVMVQAWLDQAKDWWTDLNALLELPNVALSVVSLHPVVWTLLLLVGCALLFSWRFNLNTFGLNQFYRNRLVRCYLGATRWMPGKRKPNGFTGFDDDDDINLAELQYAEILDPNKPQHFRGPFPIINCSLNLGGSSDLEVHTRQSASFFLTPLVAGAHRDAVGFAPVKKVGGYARRITLGQAIAISGAAASPNMGYNTSPLVAVLLTLFNVRLGWWFPNPCKTRWNQQSPGLSVLYLLNELLGLADERSHFINVSDGGHFENLGIYELVRRRTKVIIACDGECDESLTFGSLGNVIRTCETDFGAVIDLDVSSIRRQMESSHGRSHCAVGRITYSNGSFGYLIYLKASLTGDEDLGIAQYHSSHPDFPHQSTGNQFYSEDQFEAYRRLGHHIALSTFRAAANEPNILLVADKLNDVWAPAGSTSESFMRHTRALDQIWERIRRSGATLADLWDELRGAIPALPGVVPVTREETCVCLEILQLMENVFMDLRLDVFWDHPDNRGWAIQFSKWAKSPRLRQTWVESRQTFGIRFEYFCSERLGMPTDRHVARV